MSQPTRWLWGVIPLALLWGVGNLFLDDAIQRDVARRAEQAVQAGAGAAPGARPVTAQVEGRDVTIGGEVISADGAAKAMTQLRSEFGVRRALGGLSQVVAQKPYSWFVSRLPNVVTVGGFVPDLSVADANAAAFTDGHADTVAAEEGPAVIGGVGGDFADIEPAEPVEEAVELFPECGTGGGRRGRGGLGLSGTG